ncbi:hypothetical protein SLEP1_g43326 [Rubroshorea leprosula]|uniref:Uncharacterized protein n=1 Tax=Rubroshorea leprosula TaxID=152421 RepID=A0AAV5LCM8_9ROSI|nr:hypothetical protein SLEP1_g43326 [Rubroshorea leprosula]
MESLVFRAQTAQRKVSVWRLFSVRHIEKEAEGILNHMHGIGLVSKDFVTHNGVMLSRSQRPRRAFTERMKDYMQGISGRLGEVIKHLDGVTLHVQDEDVNFNAVANSVIDLREVCDAFGAVGMALHCSELLVTIRQGGVARSNDILQRLREETNKLFLHLEVLIQYDEMIFESFLKEGVEDALFLAALFGGFCLHYWGGGRWMV